MKPNHPTPPPHWPPHEPPPPHGHHRPPPGPPAHRTDTPVLRALLASRYELESVEDVTKILVKYEPELLPALKKFVADGISHVPTLVHLIARQDRVRAEHAMQAAIIGTHMRAVAVVLPLPRHIVDDLLDAATNELDLVLNAETSLPDHLRRYRIGALADVGAVDLKARMSRLDALVVEGIDNGSFKVRRPVARLIHELDVPDLRLYVHTLPHAPSHVEFTTLDGDYTIVRI